MILHNAAAVAVVLLTLAVAQENGHDMAGVMGQGGGVPPVAASSAPDRHSDAARRNAAVGAISSAQMNEGMDATSAQAALSGTRRTSSADCERTAQIVERLQNALARFKDHQLAGAGDSKPFRLELPHHIYDFDFTRWQNGLKAAFMFAVAAPVSLLYKKTSNEGYELVGTAYTALGASSEAKLDRRVPLGIARWDRQVNLCILSEGQDADANRTASGFADSISTGVAHGAFDGRFYPQVFGRTVQVSPWATTQRTAWAH